MEGRRRYGRADVRGVGAEVLQPSKVQAKNSPNAAANVEAQPQQKINPAGDATSGGDFKLF
ncbi:hypothetical protein [Candidatus Magnetominusculus dajiuhuensis]|uniref:hypothetical protein n=1 Tax=Candidatus Magnetominusculus dajiuhuensis TaxID=3137712 RepID=UPI003B42A69D